jgi:transcriptional regulator with XRE-family HTH domain
MQAVTSPVPVIGKASDQDFIIDLQIIARGEPGKGAALQRMIDRADTTQQAVADALGVSRPLVSSWCSETRVPSDVQVRNALLALKVDRKLILEFLGPVTVSSDAEFDPQATAVTIVSKLFAVDDPFEREWIIYTEERAT